MRRPLSGIRWCALALALPLPLAAEVRLQEGQKEPWLRVLVLEAPSVRVRPSAEAQGMRVLDERGLPLGLEPQGSTLELDGARQQRELWLDEAAARTPDGDPERRLSRLAAWVLAADRAGLAVGLRLGGQEWPPDAAEAQRRTLLDALGTWRSP